MIYKNPLVKKIIEGEAKDDLLHLLLQKELPFTEEEYLESLVYVLRLNDESLKNKAFSRLREISESVKATYIEKAEANHRVAYFIIQEALDQKNLPTISIAVRNQALPYEFLLKIAEKGGTSMLEVLLDNQIKLIAYPEIMDEMEKNPKATPFIKGKIKEIREFYLENPEVEEIQEETVMEDVKEILTMEKEKKKETEGREEEDELVTLDLHAVEERTKTTLQEINALSISERIRLALTGERTQRMILVKDPNKMVALSVLESPKISIDEIALLARNKSLPSEVIAKISKKRDWTKNYIIIHELVQNPKTPINDALSFIKKLYLKDLQMISRDKNINPVVRSLALNYYRQKSGVKQ
jgi:hypothetical protein